MAFRPNMTQYNRLSSKLAKTFVTIIIIHANKSLIVQVAMYLLSCKMFKYAFV